MMNNNSVPPGFRFYPTEQELVSFYLKNRLENTRVQDIERVIPPIDVYAFDPWQLPEMSGEYCILDSEQWFFFCPMQEREAQGGRPARTTPSGYWKATGSPSGVYANNRMIGVRKTMVFYQGRAPLGAKTKWKMNEYKYVEERDAAISSSASGRVCNLRNEFSLCRVYIKSGCLRAFDRRPVGPVRMGEASSSTVAPVMMAKRASSQGSSSSSEHQNNQTDAGTAATDVQMIEDIDLELLDWL
ncbi:hypothetical protein J5N97_021352 [Dioscorea zingiberensis]|uniref:NAC domain-containing protein n=1 Tax=Dioscorea zingiberensis TaxID=325984 RepID=A0A9D5CHH8_9LILI|nr:hypothetical protein J5N97_021352 [Dioscorea zingiberensis]